MREILQRHNNVLGRFRILIRCYEVVPVVGAQRELIKIARPHGKRSCACIVRLLQKIIGLLQPKINSLQVILYVLWRQSFRTTPILQVLLVLCNAQKSIRGGGQAVRYKRLP